MLESNRGCLYVYVCVCMCVSVYVCVYVCVCVSSTAQTAGPILAKIHANSP